jgi:hypothetical protein
MMELAMTAFHSHLNPAVIFQQIDQFVNFHLESLHAMQKSRIDMTHNVKVTGAERLYRAASVWTAGLALFYP